MWCNKQDHLYVQGEIMPTIKEVQINSKKKLIEYQGVVMTMNRWAVFAGINRGTLRTRINNWEQADWFKGTEIDDLENITLEIVDRRLRTNKICNICELPMKNWRNDSQVYCIYTPAQKKKYKVEESPCQKIARLGRMKLWRRGRTTNGKKITHKKNTERRVCLSTLSNLEEHWFDSEGPFNRVCEACHTFDEISTVYNRPASKVVMSKKQTTSSD